MNGYSRIKRVRKERSKSMDYFDTSSSSSSVPKTPNPIKNHTTKPCDNKENLQRKNTDINEPIQENGNGEIFGVILSRKCCSVSSNPPSNIFLSEKQSSSLSVNSALQRTLSSIKRSSSVSDGYCRIHHQSDPPPDDDDILMLDTSQTRSMKKKGKFFEACKRLLGF